MSICTTWLSEAHLNGANAIIQSHLVKAIALRGELEAQRIKNNLIDGEIIGTGESDFTKGNVEYEFYHQGKAFLLVDVPGIEGDEGKYEHLVNCAVAKAHIVFYVNGTNKKPESKTAERIKRYLNRDAMVYAICNLKGKADSYEFDEDRIHLEITHKDLVDIREQTRIVLEEILGKEILASVKTVQGLLAFCSVAYDDQDHSSIARSRHTDLLKWQNGFLDQFGCKSHMRQFSNICELEQIITSKLISIKDDIVESNKKKLIRLVSNTIVDLEHYLRDHEELTERIRLEIEYCGNAITEKCKGFNNRIKQKRRLAMNNLFTDMSDIMCNIIREHLYNKSRIEKEIGNCIKTRECLFTKEIEELHRNELADLDKGIQTALKQLEENVSRIRFQVHLHKEMQLDISLKTAIESANINLMEIGGVAFQVGSYAFLGFTLGSVVPGIGNIAGAIAGAIIGIVFSVLGFLLGGKETKIRDAQKKTREAIEKARDDYKIIFQRETQKFLDDVKTQKIDPIKGYLKHEYDNMQSVSHILRIQLEKINLTYHNLKSTPYGSI